MSKRSIVLLLVISLLLNVTIAVNNERQRIKYANTILGSVLKNLQITAWRLEQVDSLSDPRLTDVGDFELRLQLLGETSGMIFAYQQSPYAKHRNRIPSAVEVATLQTDLSNLTSADWWDVPWEPGAERATRAFKQYTDKLSMMITKLEAVVPEGKRQWQPPK